MISAHAGWFCLCNGSVLSSSASAFFYLKLFAIPQGVASMDGLFLFIALCGFTQFIYPDLLRFVISSKVGCLQLFTTDKATVGMAGLCLLCPQGSHIADIPVSTVEFFLPTAPSSLIALSFHRKNFLWCVLQTESVLESILWWKKWAKISSNVFDWWDVGKHTCTCMHTFMRTNFLFEREGRGNADLVLCLCDSLTVGL